MRVIVAGSRTITDSAAVAQAINASGFKITELVSGHEPHGVDRLGELWAFDRDIPVKLFPPPWITLKRAAGPARNEAMAHYAHALIAVWAGHSAGTRDMIARARNHGLKVFIHSL